MNKPTWYDWIAYQIVVYWPFGFEGLAWCAYLWLMAYAGRYAHYDPTLAPVAPADKVGE